MRAFLDGGGEFGPRFVPRDPVASALERSKNTLEALTKFHQQKDLLVETLLR